MADDKSDAQRPGAPPENAAAEKGAVPDPAPAEPQRAPAERAPESSLGKMIAAARERRGFSQSAVSKDAHIPPYYVRMIENDDYTLISDQLYLLPFLRKYASFVGLDPEEVASRSIRDVQRADVSAARMSEPIPMAERRRRRPWLRVAAIVLAVIAAVLIGDLGYRMLFPAHKSGLPGPSPAASASPAAPVVAAPPVSAVPVAPPSANGAPSNTGASPAPRSGERLHAAPRPAPP